METLTLKKNLQEKIKKTYQLPLPELIFQAQEIHRQNNNANEVQFCTLSSIKTGACVEDCKYCSQSARYNTGLKYEPLSDEAKVMDEARAAKANGSTRFCMGAAWREAPDNEQFDQVLSMVKQVKAMEMEPCVTLGMLTKDQATKLKEAGLHSYNHNLDTSEKFYSEVITTRTYQDRLNTIKNVQDAGVEVCSGGILGMGEGIEDRLSMLETLASMDPQPASVPINVLVPIPGTPLEAADPIEDIELIRLIATTRIMIPNARVRLSAGRHAMSETLQAFCFIAGANSIHTGEKLLTTPLQGKDKDRSMIEKLGMSIMS
jgi:biotin synthase